MDKSYAWTHTPRGHLCLIPSWALGARGPSLGQRAGASLLLVAVGRARAWTDHVVFIHSSADGHLGCPRSGLPGTRVCQCGQDTSFRLFGAEMAASRLGSVSHALPLVFGFWGPFG